MAVLILLVFAFVLFVISALLWRQPEPQPYRYSLVAAGLACWVLAEILGHWPALR